MILMMGQFVVSWFRQLSLGVPTLRQLDTTGACIVQIQLMGKDQLRLD
jgi:hypothetical protein